jgi:competence protein ComEA
VPPAGLASAAVPEIPPRQLVACGLAALALAALAAWHLSRGGGGADAAAPPPAAIRVDDGASGGGSVIVHVAGAVHRPGVYRMRPEARVDDAVGRAGGPTRRADLSQVNLAAKVEDGRQVLVPEKVRAAAAGGGGPATAAEPPPGVPLNLNTATLEQLDELDGIGPTTAQSIIDYREEHGGFGSVEELGQVPGIGDVRLASLREQVRV